MKRIRALPGPTPGLEAYLAEAGDDQGWADFRSFGGSTDAYWELADALEDRQHGLCGYCEVRVRQHARQIEHVNPQSRHSEAALDHRNLIACCRGTGPRRKDLSEGERRGGRNASCGNAKGDRTPADLIDPRELPAIPSVFRVLDDGRIEADPAACETLRMDAARVERTISVLGLNVPRLRVARERRWTALRNLMGERLPDPELVRASAEQELLPDETDRLPAYFTTARSFFETRSDIVHEILNEVPQRWI